MLCNKSKAKLEKLQQSAGETLHSAQDTLHDALEHAPARLDDWRHSAGEALHGASEALQGLVSTLNTKADTLRHLAEVSGTAAMQSARKFKEEHADDAHAVASIARHQAERQYDRMRAKAKNRRNDFLIAHAPVMRVENKSEKWMWLAVGVGIGTALGILFASDAGRRNRQWLRNQWPRESNHSGDVSEAVARRAADISQRAEDETAETPAT